MIDNPATALSGGQKKLLEIGRALMAEPRLVLLDEPTAGVNPTLQNEIGERLLELPRRGITVLLIEHHMRVVMGVSDRICVLNFGKRIADSFQDMMWIEPIWKMMWSNKALLAVLWEMFPNHPNLLPAYFEPHGTSYVKKPKLAREGANVSVVRDGKSLVETAGDYGDEGYIYQELLDLPNFDGNYPVLGCWIVDGEPAGMGIREGGLVTNNTARFVPHVFQSR